MPPADPGGPAPPVPAADLTAPVALLREASAARIAVDEPAAAALLSVSPKTVSRLPAHLVGRFKIGTSVRHSTAKLREYVESLTGDAVMSVTCST